MERHGRYSVCSAYRLCVTELVDSSHIWRLGYWSGICKLKVMPKVKNLVWRMSRGCLPTRVRFLDKGIVCPTNCASCASNHEDLMHVSFYCPFSIEVWNRPGLWGSVQHALSNTASATDAIFSLLENLSVELVQHMSTVLWSIWKHCNLRVWDDATETSATVVEHARNMVVDWHLANTPVVLASSTNHQPTTTLDMGASTSLQHNVTMLAASYARKIQM